MSPTPTPAAVLEAARAVVAEFRARRTGSAYQPEHAALDAALDLLATRVEGGVDEPAQEPACLKCGGRQWTPGSAKNPWPWCAHCGYDKPGRDRAPDADAHPTPPPSGLDLGPRAVADVLAQLADLRTNTREEGATNGEMVDLVGRLLNPDGFNKPHPRSRIELCAAMLVYELERLDRKDGAK